MAGTDWNGNGRVDAGDWYIDYEIMNEKNGGGGGGGSGDDGGAGCGCLCLIVIALIIQSFIW